MNKKRVLLSAFACKPFSGSEWGVGWNFFINLSKFYDVHLITESAYRSEIEEECEKLDIPRANLTFIRLSDAGRRKLHNQGDWTFYFHYHLWQRKALAEAKILHKKYQFSLVHHVNMIGFREPGLLYKLNIPFVLGPLGGFGGIPNGYFDRKHKTAYMKNVLKSFLNYASLYLPHVRAAIKNAIEVVVAYPEAANLVQKHFEFNPKIIPETGMLEFNMGSSERKNFVWIGKDLFRKQFKLAAEAFQNSEISSHEKLIVIGDFSEAEVKKWSKSKSIVFLNQISHREVMNELSAARALIFTSLHEGNPHVVYEAIANRTPVICHDIYGMGMLVSERIGIKIPAINYKNSKRLFTRAIDQIVTKEFCVEDFKSAQINNSWSTRAASFKKIYDHALEDNE